MNLSLILTLFISIKLICTQRWTKFSPLNVYFVPPSRLVFHSSPDVYFLLTNKEVLSDTIPSQHVVTITTTPPFDYRSSFSHHPLKNIRFCLPRRCGPVLKIGLVLKPLVCFELVSFILIFKVVLQNHCYSLSKYLNFLCSVRPHLALIINKLLTNIT